MFIQPLPAVLQPPREFRVSPAEPFFSCVTSAFPDVIWSLLTTWEIIPPSLSSSTFSHGKIKSLHPAKQSNFFVPSLYFWLCSMTLSPSLGCLPVSQGLNFLAEVLDSPCQNLCHPLLSSGGFLWIHPSQLHCSSLGCWRALWWTHPSHFSLSCASTLVLPLYLPANCFLPSCLSALSAQDIPCVI